MSGSAGQATEGREPIGSGPAVIRDAIAPEQVPDALVQRNGTRLSRILGPARDYANNCQGCHGHEGRSVDEMPTLLGRVGYFARVPEGRAYLIQVPNVAQSHLDSARIAALMNWVLSTYSPDELPESFQPYTVLEVERLRRVRIEPLEQRQKVIEALVARGELADGAFLALPPFRNY